jgi:hypothetical protein
MSGNNETPISEQTPVRLSVILAVMAVCVTILGGSGTFVWWASGVSTRLKAIEVYMQNETGKAAVITDLSHRVKLMEAFGTPKAVILEERVNKLREEFEMHKAMAKNKGQEP